MSIGIAGGGAFGTALAVSLAATAPVTLWCRDPGAASAMAESRINERRLPGVPIPGNVTPTSDLSALFARDVILLCVPAQQVGSFLTDNASDLAGKALIACCKGIDVETLTGPATAISKTVPDATAAMLTGPSFATDIARGLPTALTLACAEPDEARDLQHQLTTPNLRLYRTTDVIGAELGGALKNVVAIAAGACIGRGYGDSARAALMTRGFAEMQRLAAVQGADPLTLMGLSGFGDLALTCTSDLSRNYRFGLAWGRREPPDAAMTVEGVRTAEAIARLAAARGIDMPITTLVADVVAGRQDIGAVLETLLSRPLKEE